MVDNQYIELESVVFERLIGTKTMARWVFTVRFEDSNWCCVYQPALLKYSRAGVLGTGASRTEIGEKITLSLSDEAKELVLRDVELLTKQNALYAKMRRDKDRLLEDLGGFIASVILQNFRPNETSVNEVEDIIRSFFKKGLVKRGKNCDLYFGDHYYGFFFLNKTI